LLSRQSCSFGELAGFEPVTFGSVDALEAFCTALSRVVRGYESG